MKQKLIDLKGEIHKSTILGENVIDFYRPLHSTEHNIHQMNHPSQSPSELTPLMQTLNVSSLLDLAADILIARELNRF